jgi:hypothetical protein
MDRRTLHTDACRTRLAHLGGLAAKTHQAERKLLEAATNRMAAVAADLDTLRPRVNVDQGAADRYMELTEEWGTLATVIAQAQHHTQEGAPA